MPLHNPWPPTPPQMSPYPSSVAVNDLSVSREALIPSAAYVPYSRDLRNFFGFNDFSRRPAQREENRFIRTFALTAERTRIHFMIAYAQSREMPIVIHADIAPKRCPRRGQAKLLHLLLVVQGRRCAPQYLRTRHSQSRIRPEAARI